MSVASAMIEATVRTATPLALAALGELVVERAGIINLGIEGSMIAGAFAALAFAGATSSTVAGYAGAVVAGAAVTMLLAFWVIRLRADQIITGTALSLLALGASGTAYRLWYGAGGAGLRVVTSGTMATGAATRIPLLGPALFLQPYVILVWCVAAPFLAWMFRRTHAGLSLRAVGDEPDAALASGIRVGVLQTRALLFGGGMAGLAGAVLVLAQTGTFAEGMTAGRGFIALGVVVLGRWKPLGVTLAALLFGGATAVQFVFQAMGWNAPYQLFLALPYVLTLAALATVGGRAESPTALGRMAVDD